jgi:hypothetical protein
MFFIDHLWGIALVSFLVCIAFLIGAFTSQLIDIQHSGKVIPKLMCAIYNNEEHCRSNDVGMRGWLHSFEFLAYFILLTVAMMGASMGLLIHFMMDGLI